MQKMFMEVQPLWCYCNQLHVTSQNKGENDSAIAGGFFPESETRTNDGQILQVEPH